ncbi:MAG: hypothetical protein RR400_03695 [Clostridia bacterium]
MGKYELMRKAENQDEGTKEIDLCEEEIKKTQTYKKNYFDFYNDIKTNVKQDW